MGSFGLSNRVLLYLCEEVERQRDSPLAVYWFADAWQLAAQQRDVVEAGQPALPSALQIEEWGRRVSPLRNAMGFRRGNVRVGDHIPKPWPLYLEDLEYLLRGLRETSIASEDAYRFFQEAHPFMDGNGRTGKILYNYLRDTMRQPAMPPNFWGISNP